MRTFTFVLFGVLGILGTASLDCSFKGISVNWLQVHGGPPAKGANIGTRDSRTIHPGYEAHAVIATRQRRLVRRSS